jgi:predicted  nucleic acid-binding Zn-ribbon protein
VAVQKRINPTILAAGVIILFVFILLIFFLNSNLAKIREYQARETKLKQAIGELNQALENSQTRFKEAAASLSRAQQELAEVKGQLQTVSEKCATLTKDRDSLSQVIEKLGAEKKAWEEKFPQAKIAAQAKKEEEVIPTGDEYMARLLKEKAALNVEIASLNEKLRGAEEKIKSVEGNIEPTRSLLDRTKTEKEALEGEVVYAKKVSDELTKDLVNARYERSKLEEQLNQYRQDNEDLKKELSEVLNRKSSAENKLARLDYRLENLTQQRDDLLKQLERAKEEIKIREAKLESTQSVLDKTAQVAGTTTRADTVELAPIVVRPESTPNYPLAVTTPLGLEGKILKINTDKQFAVINLGEEDGVKPGMELMVYQMNRPAGLLKVMEVRKKISAADIVKLFAARINEGDVVRTPNP